VSLDIEDPDRLRAAEAKVARAPSRAPYKRNAAPTRGGRVAWFLTPVLAVAACASAGAGVGGIQTQIYILSLGVVLVPSTVFSALAAGELGGRLGRVIGIICGVAVIPPISIVIGSLLWAPFN